MDVTEDRALTLWLGQPDCGATSQSLVRRLGSASCSHRSHRKTTHGNIGNRWGVMGSIGPGEAVSPQLPNFALSCMSLENGSEPAIHTNWHRLHWTPPIDVPVRSMYGVDHQTP